MKYLFLYEDYNTGYNRSEYLKWKRKNVTFRGTNDPTKPNGPSDGVLGAGLYTAFLSNKSMAKEYGELYYVVGAIPKNPLKFRNLNEWEIWMQTNLLKPYDYDRREFSKVTTIRNEILKLGFDGVVIKGREMVNYTPDDSVKYYRYEEGVIEYYIRTAMKTS
jgi:hypothetical protein